MCACVFVRVCVCAGVSNKFENPSHKTTQLGIYPRAKGEVEHMHGRQPAFRRYPLSRALCLSLTHSFPINSELSFSRARVLSPKSRFAEGAAESLFAESERESQRSPASAQVQASPP